MARARTRMSCTIRCKGGQLDQHRRHRQRRAGASPAGARPASATSCWRVTRRGTGAQPLREFLAVPERWQKWALYDLPPLGTLGQRSGDAARGCCPPDVAVPRPGRRDGDRGCGGAGRPAGAHARRSRRRDAALRARAAQAHGAGAARRPPATGGSITYRGRGVGTQHVFADRRRKDAAAPLQLAL